MHAPTLCGDETAPPDARVGQYLRFVVGGSHCALRVEGVREILELGPLTAMPLVPGFVSGVMNLRGSVVPVFDLSARLGLAPIVPGRRSCIVIVEVASRAEEEAAGGPGGKPLIGLLVDSVQEVLDVAGPDCEPVPRLGTRIAPAFLRQLLHARGAAIPELDLDTVLDLRVLADLIGEHAARP